ncbi:type II secretion system protein GspK [Azospirillum griseum]|uniref:General secretion pathway protein K n=1 Tax=Azospirillum griseum TaxID=2496639 RepID=A0A3S0KB46_9PROT|nr:type II secretion system protein GspK [Azospirillum griseum]RTR20184.1 hypothetical protein EJ903_11630 [Azospirillum griseum]
MTRRPPFPRQAGFALVLVLGVVAVAATLAAGLATTARYEVRRIANVGAGAEARALLDAGVALGVLGATDPDLTHRIATDGTPRALPFGGGRLELRVFEEAGRVDLNRAPAALLAALFGVIGVANPAELAQAVVQWRGDDDTDGASALSPNPDGLPRRSFLSVEELASVPGAPPDLPRRLGEALTVDGSILGTVPSVAGPLVRAALPERRPAQAALDQPDPTVPSVGRVVSVRVRATGAAGGVATAEATVLLLDPPDPVPYRVLEWREPVPFSLGSAP